MVLGGMSGPAHAEHATMMQSFPRIPKVRLPEIPKVPQLPAIPGLESITGQGEAGASANSGELTREYLQETGLLAYPINTNWSSEADNARIEKAVAEYLERVERVASGRFDRVPAQQRSAADSRLRAHYDTLANTADREIAGALRKIGQIGVADSAYNDMLVLDAALYGAVTLYPDVAEYQTAKQKSAAALAKFGSREGASNQKEELAMAEARKVKMRPATDTSAASVQQFRQAWATGGIPYTIRTIHIQGDWGVKRNALGEVIGRTRDAQIAAQDPETGRCNLYDFTMIIETGGSPRRSSHSAKRMACENIP
jgi:hypothetical protein